MRILLFCLLAFATAIPTSSCKKESKDKGAELVGKAAKSGASRPIAMSSVVMATVQMPTGTKLEGLAKAIDNIQPGASAAIVPSVSMLLAKTMGMDLSGADLGAPIALLVVNPQTYSKPIAMLVSAADKAKLESAAKAAGLAVASKKDLVLIGEASVVEAVRDVAFQTLSQTSQELVVRIFPGSVLAGFKDDLHEAFQTMTTLMTKTSGQASGVSAMLLAYEEMIVAIGDQTDVIEMRVAASDGASDFLFRMQPKAGTTMAALAQAQIPSKHALLGKLPQNTSGSILFSGDMRAGKARQPMIDFSMKVMSVMMPAKGNEVLTKALTTWFESFDGQMAVNMNMDMGNTQVPKFEATYLMGATDAAVMRKGWREMMVHMSSENGGTTEMMGMKFDIEFEEKVLEVDGVEVDRYQTKLNTDGMSKEDQALSIAPGVEQKMHMATFDDLAVMSLSDNSEAAVSSAIAAARGKAPGYKPEGATAKALARSKSLNESLIFTLDIGRLAPTGVAIPFGTIAMGFGQDKGALTMRISVRK
tara:strand:+ start:63360 stop:64955 length:1596 start_codon:yes stop_codon:yes gene_type:complete